MITIRNLVSIILLLSATIYLVAQGTTPQKPKTDKPAAVEQQRPAEKPPAEKSATPQSPAVTSSGVFKMGFINLEQALSQVDEGRKDFGEVEKFVNAKSTQLKSKQDEIDKLRKQLEAQANTLKEDAKAQLQREIDNKETDVRRFTEDAQRELEGKRNVVIDKIGKKMQPLINTIAKEQNYAAILIFSPQAAPLYAYIDLERYDITNEVVKRYNVAHPVASAQSAPEKPAPGQK